jgi:hypothetical protein
MILGPPLYILLANLAYSVGWLVDRTFFNNTARAWQLRAGIVFSMALTSLPGLWAIVAWLTTIGTGKKLD